MLGFEGSRIYNPDKAEQITSEVHYFVKALSEHPKIFYVDTDGLYFSPIISEEEREDIRDTIKQVMIERNINFNLVEEEYKDMYVLGKTHYLARDKGGHITMRGITSRRGDKPLLLQKLQRESMLRIMDGVSLSKVEKYARDVLNDIHNEPLENIVIPRGMKKKDYDTNVQQQRAYDYSKKVFGYKPDLHFEKIRILHIKYVPFDKRFPPTDVLNYFDGIDLTDFVVDYETHKKFILHGLAPLFEKDEEKDLLERWIGE